MTQTRHFNLNYLNRNYFGLTQIGGIKSGYDWQGKLIYTIGFVKVNGIRYGYCRTTKRNINRWVSFLLFSKKWVK